MNYLSSDFFIKKKCIRHRSFLLVHFFRTLRHNENILTTFRISLAINVNKIEEVGQYNTFFEHESLKYFNSFPITMAILHVHVSWPLQCNWKSFIIYMECNVCYISENILFMTLDRNRWNHLYFIETFRQKYDDLWNFDVNNNILLQYYFLF